jgi:hypothetical protein
MGLCDLCGRCGGMFGFIMKLAGADASGWEGDTPKAKRGNKLYWTIGIYSLGGLLGRTEVLSGGRGLRNMAQPCVELSLKGVGFPTT